MSETPDMSQASTVRAQANLHLPHSDRAPRLARAFVAESLHGWQLDDLIEPVSLLASEVVTNAVIHARSDADLVLERTPNALRISVTDRGEGMEREVGGVSDGGRGLLIVEQLSSRWGAEPTSDGNRVWAEIPIGSGL
ncbi:MAG TPA: ATP-binding protein [Acidimicrobiales bacterium]|nr:ATP-binding protein [Acidimicrobiales bacterium]